MHTDFSTMHAFLMKELRLMHNPVGFTFLYSEEEKASFEERYEFYVPTHTLTFCQAELAPRMENHNLMLDMDKVWCKSARICFGLKDIDDTDIHNHIKFCESEEQARRVVESKPRMQGKKPIAMVLMPLGNFKEVPHVVHFCCDNMQAYHLLNDWMAVEDIHPMPLGVCVNSALCGGTAFAIIHNQANLTLSCAGSYNSGKMERGEINVMIPGAHMEKMAARMQRRIDNVGGVSLTRCGEPFPGADICQNCPLISFKKA